MPLQQCPQSFAGKEVGVAIPQRESLHMVSPWMGKNYLHSKVVGHSETKNELCDGPFAQDYQVCDGLSLLYQGFSWAERMRF
mmetsp:Transcript_23465/g.30668  ORF Transcript_23465/g.30668 Transcript_23465/m.30668 type:complete len:82 (+) Transcript_23465:186-431(+)